MSNIDKQALRERYSEKPAPKCHICGSVMTIQRAGAGSVVYGCTGRIDKDGEGYKFAEGRDFADDHYARSRVTDYGPGGDPDVLALLDELEAAEKRIAELEVRAFNPALLDVISERQRQRAIEGWTSEHDDAYQNSELADAAACYAIHAHNQGFSTPAHWPWAPEWWKQSGARRDLVKAGALILAEIERLDRAAGKGE